MDGSSLPLQMDTSVSAEGSHPPTPVTANTPTSVPTTPINAASSLSQKRRSSTRSIKRKKFDDELVESSLAKTDRYRTTRLPSFPSLGTPVTSISPSPTLGVAPLIATPPIVTPTPDVKPPLPPDVTPVQTSTVSNTATPPVISTCLVSSPVTSVPPVTVPVTNVPITPAEPTTSTATTIDIATPVFVPDKKKPKTSSKRSKKSKPPPAGSTKDLGRWKPQDDLALINGVQQTCDLTAVFHAVKFSCKFTLKEIQERWYALMYDSVLSKLAVQAIKQLHPDVVAEINSKALYSKDEENLLKNITSVSLPNVDTFEDLLHKHNVVFHSGRTAKALYTHWLLLKQYHLLPDQSVPPMPKGDHVLNFSDAEDMINEEELRDPRDDSLELELAVADRRQKREIRHVEQELPKWQVLVDSVTGISPPDFDNQTLAVLRGRLVRYLMRSREITLGRATKDNQIDVDLSLEGPAWKISRRQGMIKLKSTGEFYIANEGKRPIYIDSKPVLMGSKQKLNNNSVVEISCLRFIFLINQDLVGVIRQDSQKSGI